MIRQRRSAAVPFLALVMVAATVSLSPGTGVAAASTPARSQAAVALPIEVVPVSFAVKNLNRSAVPCSSDNRSYTIAGHLVRPIGGTGDSVTLYLHGLGFGEWFWRFTTVGGYDFATAEARAGHVSVVIDRLGYGASGHPVGTATCLGAQADIAHQIVSQLRAGSYTDGTSRPQTFERVALAGHSAGGAIAEIEAYSFRDIDALAVVAYADLGASPTALIAFAKTGQSCLLGPGGYANFGHTGQDFQALMFHHADPRVERASVAMRNADPCGDIESFPAAIAEDVLRLPTIKIPVLLVYGANDALFPPPAATVQRLLLPGSPDVRTVVLGDTGHAVTLELSAHTLRDVTATWLAAHGL